MTFVLTGLDIPEKAKRVEDTFWRLVGGRERFAEATVSLLRLDREDADDNALAQAHLTFTVKDPDPKKVGRAFSGRAVELALAHYPGFHLTGPPADESAVRRLLASGDPGRADRAAGARRRRNHCRGTRPRAGRRAAEP